MNRDAVRALLEVHGFRCTAATQSCEHWRKIIDDPEKPATAVVHVEITARGVSVRAGMPTWEGNRWRAQRYAPLRQATALLARVLWAKSLAGVCGSLTAWRP